MSFPLIVTAAIILEDDYILLTRNKHSIYGSDMWGFPAGIGGFRKTSNPDEAIIHEVAGDIGCHFSGELTIVNPYFEPVGEPPCLTLFYVGSITGTPRPVCHNVLDVAYFSLDEAMNIPLRYNHKEALEDLLKL